MSYTLYSTKQHGKLLYLNFSLNDSILGCVSSDYNIHDFAWVRLKREDSAHSISIKKHELSKELKVTLKIECFTTDFNIQHVCLDEWSNWIRIGEIDTDLFEFSVEMIDVSKVELIKTKVYEDADFTDFELKASDGCVCVHRTILAAHSDVFKTMLNGEWKETAQGFVEVEGVTLQTLQHLKEYMYLETLPDNGLQPLLLIAKRYMIDNLFKACNMKMIQTVSEKNLYTLLEFAMANDIPQLVHNILQKTKESVLNSALELKMQKHTCKADTEG